MPAPGETPKAAPIVTEHLLALGGDAKLEDKTITMNVETERSYVRSLNATDRAKLKTNIVAWEAKNGREAHAVHVKEMLARLKADLDATDRGIVPIGHGSDYLDIDAGVSKLIESTVGAGGVSAFDGLKKIPQYGRDELQRFMRAETTQEKIGIAGKNALLLGAGYGLYRLFNWMTSGVDKSVEKGGGWYYVWHLLKWTGLIAATGWTAKALLGKNAPLAASTAPTATPTKASERTVTPTATVDMRTIPVGRNLLKDVDIDDAAKTEKRINITVDTEDVTILPPVNDTGTLEIRIVIGRNIYTITPKPSIKPPISEAAQNLYDRAKRILIDEHKDVNGDRNGRSTLEAVKNNVSVARINDEIIQVSLMGGNITADVKMNDLAALVRAVRNNPNPSVNLEVTLPYMQKILGTTTQDSQTFIIKESA